MSKPSLKRSLALYSPILAYRLFCPWLLNFFRNRRVLIFRRCLTFKVRFAPLFFRAPDYNTTSLPLCQHFFSLYLKVFSSCCQAGSIGTTYCRIMRKPLYFLSCGFSFFAIFTTTDFIYLHKEQQYFSVDSSQISSGLSFSRVRKHFSQNNRNIRFYHLQKIF